MRKLLSLLLLVLVAGLLLAQTASKKTATKGTAKSAATGTIVTPDKMQWSAAPPALPAGGQLAVLSGNPGAVGPFVIRLKLPDGYRIMPHWHPTAENITVISGEFHVGMGDKFDESALQTLPAGSYGSVPAHHNHYAMAHGATELQINSIGPFKLVYVNPADDPSKKK